jgi:hypothetical protein
VSFDSAARGNKSTVEINMDVSEISRELSEGKLSRRGLADRLKVLGLGFGAAFALGVTGAQAATTPDASVALKSTNVSIDSIIKGPQVPTAAVGTPMEKTAWFRRWFRRFYNRYYYHRNYFRTYARY